MKMHYKAGAPARRSATGFAQAREEVE
jgi:hypothetical protein